jgi:sugar phosphate isomerase/epimerase
MTFVYFTKLLQGLDLKGVIGFLKECGLDGADFTVRPGFPVTPDNCAAELPAAAAMFKDNGLTIGLVTGPTNLDDAESAGARTLFEACAKAGVPAIKIGYFQYKGEYEKGIAFARSRLAGFAKLAARTGVRACYHTHSGAYLGNNAAGLRSLLTDLDPHHVGAFLDTGHTAINGGPIRMEIDVLRPWLSLIAIKDMLLEKAKAGYAWHVVPAGDGIVRWDDFARGVKEAGFRGTISLHGEYEIKDMDARKAAAKRELALLKAKLGV